MANIIDELTASFSRLPGIGKKSAGRIVNFLLKADKFYIENFSRQLLDLQKKIKPCSVCGAWTETDPCPICSNPARDDQTICVVEQPQDVQTIEAAGGYTGLFHVLGGVIDPLEGMGPDQLNIASLCNRVARGGIKEIIVATNPTHAGDATAMYIQQILQPYTQTKVTRLATGIPVGGDLEYLDRLTLARSFRGRSEF
ncbi:MAG: recombination mediator RecR [Treponema sp.]|nr:recombination mediator RecR [Treponema sp.]